MDAILKVMRRIRLVVGLLVLLVAVAFVALVTRGTEPHGADQSPLSRQVAADITRAGQEPAMNHQDLRERRRADPLRQGPGAFVCVDPARPRRHVLRTLPEPCGGKKVGPRINGAVEA